MMEVGSSIYPTIELAVSYVTSINPKFDSLPHKLSSARSTAFDLLRLHLQWFYRELKRLQCLTRPSFRYSLSI